MKRDAAHLIAGVIFTILIGALLACGVAPSAAGDTLSPSASSPATDPQPAQSKPVSAVSDPALPRDFSFSLPLFTSNSAWNQTAAGVDVLPESDQQILVTYHVLRGDTTDLVPEYTEPPSTWPFPYVNYDAYTVPVFRTGAGEQSVLLCDYEGYRSWPSPKFPDDQQEGGPVTVPAPVGTIRPANPQGIDSDGHLVLYHPGNFIAYDFWQATTVRAGECQSQGGGLTGSTIFEAGAVDFFDVHGSGTNPDTYSSARAVGTPLLAGLLLPEDVESGTISHALAVAIPGLRNTSADPSEPSSSDYFYPASTTETDYYNTNPQSLAAGQRLRLGQTIVDDTGNPVDEGDLAPITRMFLRALRTYGAYLVDNAGGFVFYAEDIHTADLSLTDDQVNALIGEPPGTPLPPGKTKWQIVMEKLNEELESIPFAYGPDSADPVEAEIESANFEVVEPAADTTFYLSVTPPSHAIDPGGLATYTVGVNSDSGFTGTVDLTTTSPSPSLTLELLPTSVAAPGQATLTITDHHGGLTLMPGQWYGVPITATDGITQMASVYLLVGGARVYLPTTLKGD